MTTIYREIIYLHGLKVSLEPFIMIVTFIQNCIPRFFTALDQNQRPHYSLNGFGITHALRGCTLVSLIFCTSYWVKDIIISCVIFFMKDLFIVAQVWIAAFCTGGRSVYVNWYSFVLFEFSDLENYVCWEDETLMFTWVMIRLWPPSTCT